MSIMRRGNIRVVNNTWPGFVDAMAALLLVYAGKLIAAAISPRRACQVAIVWSLTDDGEVQRSIEEVVTSIFDE